MQLATARLVQDALEEEQADFIGRDRFAARGAGSGTATSRANSKKTITRRRDIITTNFDCRNLSVIPGLGTDGKRRRAALSAHPVVV